MTLEAVENAIVRLIVSRRENADDEQEQAKINAKLTKNIKSISKKMQCIEQSKSIYILKVLRQNTNITMNLVKLMNG